MMGGRRYIHYITCFCLEKLFSRTMNTEKGVSDERKNSVKGDGVTPVCSPQNAYSQMLMSKDKQKGVSIDSALKVHRVYVSEKQSIKNYPPPEMVCA